MSEKFSPSNTVEAVPSNRFREWFHLVPKNIRRFIYGEWRKNTKNKIARGANIQPNNIQPDGDWQYAKEEFDSAYATWEETLLKGAEARNDIEKKVSLSQKHLDEWLGQAFGDQIRREDILYAGLFGSSYITPRVSIDSDIDIGLIVKKDIPVKNSLLATGGLLGPTPLSIRAVTPEYEGKVDFFTYKEDQGNILFLLFPHGVIHKDQTCTGQTLKDLIATEINIIESDWNSTNMDQSVLQEELETEIDAFMQRLKNLDKR